MTFTATCPTNPALQLAANLTDMKLMSGGVTSELLEQIVYRLLSEDS